MRSWVKGAIRKVSPIPERARALDRARRPWQRLAVITAAAWYRQANPIPGERGKIRIPCPERDSCSRDSVSRYAKLTVPGLKGGISAVTVRGERDLVSGVWCLGDWRLCPFIRDFRRPGSLEVQEKIKGLGTGTGMLKVVFYSEHEALGVHSVSNRRELGMLWH